MSPFWKLIKKKNPHLSSIGVLLDSMPLLEETDGNYGQVGMLSFVSGLETFSVLGEGRWGQANLGSCNLEIRLM